MSTLKADTIQSTSGGAATLTKQMALRAWVNFNGTGTIATRNSINLSSLTDNGTGEYTITFSNAFSAVDYCFTGSCGQTTSTSRNAGITFDDFSSTPSTTAHRILSRKRDDQTNADCENEHCQTSGDLA